MFYFCHSKNPSNIMKNIFNCVFINSWKNIFLSTNISNTCVKWKINLYFLTSWKMVKFFLQKFIIFNAITDSFIVEKRGTLESARRHVCKNLLNLHCLGSIRFGIFQVAYNWGKSFGKRFYFPFSAKHFDYNFKCLFLDFAIS